MAEVNLTESKRDKFIRLAEARTNKIIDMLQLLGNCSNTNTYEYTQADIDQIFSAIESEVREAKKKFQKIENIRNSRFSSFPNSLEPFITSSWSGRK